MHLTIPCARSVQVLSLTRCANLAEVMRWADVMLQKVAAVVQDLQDEKEAQRRNIPLHVFHGFLDQLAHDVEQELSRLKAKSMPTAEHQATLDSLRRHQSALELRRMASVASPSTEVPPLVVGDGDGAASVSISCSYSLPMYTV